MSKPLQVGIIGASAKAGWARESHVPAVRKLDGLELGAVVVRRKDEADAAQAFGARVGYADPQALFDDPAIDIVTVAVKVPDHHDLVLGALRAGKHLIANGRCRRACLRRRSLRRPRATPGSRSRSACRRAPAPLSGARAS